MVDINQNLSNLMKEAQKMQQRMQEAQQQLTDLIVTGQAGGNMGVVVKMNGRHEVIELKINPKLVEDEDVEMLEDLVAAAFRDGVAKIEVASKKKIAELTAGLNIPKDLMDGE